MTGLCPVPGAGELGDIDLSRGAEGYRQGGDQVRHFTANIYLCGADFIRELADDRQVHGGI